MWLTIKLGWRNTFRNKRRTLIAGVAIGVGLAALTFTDALMRGMKTSMIESATAAYSGEGQIHRLGFRTAERADLTINDASRIIASLGKDEKVEAYTRRVIGLGTITSPADLRSIMLVGVDPETEPRLSRLKEDTLRGAFFSRPDESEILVGSELADILQADLGDRVVVTVSQARTGALEQEMFRVAGIFRFDIKEMDTGLAFIRLDRAQRMLAIDGGIHEIALRFKSLDFATMKNNPFWLKYSSGGNEAVSWTALFPQLKTVLGMLWVTLAFVAFVLFGVVALGIINTLFMSLYERMFEFGVVRAIGTRPAGVLRLIVTEAAALGGLSIVMGTALGFAITFAVSKIGIDYRGIEFAGTTFTRRLYPELHWVQFVLYPAAVFVFTVLVGIYPAASAARMRIADALRKSL